MLSNLFSENICDICEDGIFEGFRRSYLLFDFCRKRFMKKDNQRMLTLTLLAFLTWMVSSPSSMRMPSGVFMARWSPIAVEILDCEDLKQFMIVN